MIVINQRNITNKCVGYPNISLNRGYIEIIDYYLLTFVLRLEFGKENASYCYVKLTMFFLDKPILGQIFDNIFDDALQKNVAPG